MRLIIADDEPLLRYHLRSLASEIDGAMEILEAENGQELVDAVRRNEADAAFVDIRMPKLDGLAAMGLLKKEGSGIPWAVLTSHSEFEYAKRALETGALGYALKPPSLEEIRNLLPLLKEAVRRGRLEKNRSFAQAWSGTATDFADGSRYWMRSGIFIGDGPPGTDRPVLLPDMADRAVNDDRGRLRAASAQGRYPDTVEILCAAETEGVDQADALLKPFLNTAFAAARREEGAQRAGRALCILADPVRSLQEARERLRSIRELLDYRALLPAGLVEYERARALLLPYSAAELKAAKEAARLVREAAGAEGNPYRAASVDLIAALAAVDTEIRLRLIRYLEQIFGPALPAGKNGETDWEEELRSRLSAAYHGPSSDRDIVDSVKTYLLRHFSERLTLTEVAGIFALSPNYLSSLFHNRTGKTFLEHLTELRLEQGRDLLRAGKSVKECAWAVGYGSERHFAQLYRRRFGYPPAMEKEKREPKS